MALLLTAATAGMAAEVTPEPRTDCNPENEATWPACTSGSLCWCADADVEYRRDKVILNDLVLYQGGSPLAGPGAARRDSLD